MADGIHEFTEQQKKGFGGTDRFVDFASVESHSIRNDRYLSLKCGITKNLDGSQDELVYNSTKITDELDDSVIENLFESDCESEFEGFVV